MSINKKEMFHCHLHKLLSRKMNQLINGLIQGRIYRIWNIFILARRSFPASFSKLFVNNANKKMLT